MKKATILPLYALLAVNLFALPNSVLAGQKASLSHTKPLAVTTLSSKKNKKLKIGGKTHKANIGKISSGAKLQVPTVSRTQKTRTQTRIPVVTAASPPKKAQLHPRVKPRNQQPTLPRVVSTTIKIRTPALNSVHIVTESASTAARQLRPVVKLHNQQPAFSRSLGDRMRSLRDRMRGKQEMGAGFRSPRTGEIIAPQHISHLNQGRSNLGAMGATGIFGRKAASVKDPRTGGAIDLSQRGHVNDPRTGQPMLVGTQGTTQKNDDPAATKVSSTMSRSRSMISNTNVDDTPSTSDNNVGDTPSSSDNKPKEENHSLKPVVVTVFGDNKLNAGVPNAPDLTFSELEGFDSGHWYPTKYGGRIKVENTTDDGNYAIIWQPKDRRTTYIFYQLIENKTPAPDDAGSATGAVDPTMVLKQIDLAGQPVAGDAGSSSGNKKRALLPLKVLAGQPIPDDTGDSSEPARILVSPMQMTGQPVEDDPEFGLLKQPGIGGVMVGTGNGKVLDARAALANSPAASSSLKTYVGSEVQQDEAVPETGN